MPQKGMKSNDTGILNLQEIKSDLNLKALNFHIWALLASEHSYRKFEKITV